MDNGKLYDAFVSELERVLGPKDEAVIHAVIGFEFGGPPDLLQFRNAPGIAGTFYVTSDLYFAKDQPTNSLGRYEIALCMPADDSWARPVLANLAHAALHELFDVGHTADITVWVEPTCAIKGLLFTELVSFSFEGEPFGVLLCVGVTRAELDFAMVHGSAKLLTKLKAGGVFPLTDPKRASVV